MTLQKREYDERVYTVDLGPAMRSEDTIAMIDSVAEEDTTDLTISEVSHTGAVIEFLVSGGTAGKKYTLIIRFSTEGAPMQMIETSVDLVVFFE